MDLLLTYNYDQDKIKKIEELGFNVILTEEKNIIYQPQYKDIEVMICNNPFQNLEVDKLENLKWIQLISAGADRVPLADILNKNILLTTAGGGYSPAIAEWIIAKIMELYKKSRYYYQNQLNKEWNKDRDIKELTNKKILFFGTGSIAQETAKRLKAFDCKLYGINTNGRLTNYFNQCFTFEKADNIISEADINIITLPLTPQTYKIINYDLLNKMKKDSILINVSRGKIIDQKDLIRLLAEGHFYGAALDVFENEPLEKDSLLWEMENVIISPHVAYASEYRFDRVFNVICQNLKRFKNKKKLHNIVEMIKGY